MALSQPYTLPSGLTLSNRLIKSSMAEGMADRHLDPGKSLYNLYADWAAGGWGMILTGNVQVDANHLNEPNCVAIHKDSMESDRATTLGAWKRWADVCQADGTPTVVQLCHPGRQEPRFVRRSVFAKSVAPSAVALDFGSGVVPRVASAVVFGVPRELEIEEIREIENLFVETARLARDAGFKGVQLHGAHGYLLSSFLSPRSNTRTDEYGGTPANRARIVANIVRMIREELPGFAVGLKINSADHQQPDGLGESLEQIGVITQEKPDFLEISGGTYERPDMMEQGITSEQQEKVSERTKAREAFFLKYAQEVRQRYPDVPLLVTGGFRSRVGMQAAVEEGGCDFVGLARPAAVTPKLPKEIVLNPNVSDDDAQLFLEKVTVPWIIKHIPVKPLGAGVITKHYQTVMKKRVTAAA